MSLAALQSFVQKYQGTSVDYDKAYGAQCVDLFNFYNKEVVGAPFISTPQTNGARDLWEVRQDAADNHYHRVPSSEPLRPGDVLVYGQPLGRVRVGAADVFYGHVSIYVDNDRMIEQNGKIPQSTTISPVYRTGLLGILRPRLFDIKSEPQKDTSTPQHKNKHVIIAGDTFWGLEERYGIKHGTLQKLNPQLNPKRLAIGTEIVLREKSTAEPRPSATYYTIRQGDTFWALEDAWQLPHGKLQQLNPGVQPRALQVGQRIRRS